ncbi:hypothetical protein D3C78_850960 [compost metagenome]
MTELNGTFRSTFIKLRKRSINFLNFLFFIQKFKYPFCGSNSGLNNISNISCLCNRLGELTRILNKGLNIPDINHFLSNKDPADYTDHYITQVTNKHHERHNHTGHELGTPARVVKLIVNFIEILKGLRFTTECFNNPVTCIHFFYMTIQLTE